MGRQKQFHPVVSDPETAPLQLLRALELGFSPLAALPVASMEFIVKVAPTASVAPAARAKQLAVAEAPTLAESSATAQLLEPATPADRSEPTQLTALDKSSRFAPVPVASKELKRKKTTKKKKRSASRSRHRTSHTSLTVEEVIQRLTATAKRLNTQGHLDKKDGEVIRRHLKLRDSVPDNLDKKYTGDIRQAVVFLREVERLPNMTSDVLLVLMRALTRDHVVTMKADRHKEVEKSLEKLLTDRANLASVNCVPIRKWAEDNVVWSPKEKSVSTPLPRCPPSLGSVEASEFLRVVKFF